MPRCIVHIDADQLVNEFPRWVGYRLGPLTKNTTELFYPQMRKFT